MLNEIKNKITFVKLLQYFGGIMLVALGVNVAKMAGLGISAVTSTPRALEIIFGFTLGTTVIIVHCILVLLQYIILRNNFKMKNILGVGVAIVFGWMVDLLGTDPNAIGHLLYGFPLPQNYIMQLVYTFASILIMGFGVYLYLKPDFIPMPPEGFSAAIAQRTGISFGNAKTLVDVGMVSIALALQLIFLGGLKSFTGPNVVVREGTILTAILNGQVVKLCRKIFG